MEPFEALTTVGYPRDVGYVTYFHVTELNGTETANSCFGGLIIALCRCLQSTEEFAPSVSNMSYRLVTYKSTFKKLFFDLDLCFHCGIP